MIAPHLITRRLRNVRRRSPGGTFVNGEYQAAADTAVSVRMNIQPPTLSEYAAQAESLPAGDRTKEMVMAITGLDDALMPAGRDNYPGDLVEYDGAWWLVVRAEKHDTLVNTPVAHARHLLVRQSANEGSL